MLAYLDESERTGPTEALLAREELAPRARLLELFTALAEPRSRSCRIPFVAAAAEFPGSPSIRCTVRRSSTAARFIAASHRLARAAGARDPERSARRLVLLYDGAAGRALLEDAATVVADAYAGGGRDPARRDRLRVSEPGRSPRRVARIAKPLRFTILGTAIGQCEPNSVPIGVTRAVITVYYEHPTGVTAPARNLREGTSISEH